MQPVPLDLQSTPQRWRPLLEATSPRTAVILAAGNGVRLQAVTVGTPKCLIGVLGLSLLERNILALRDAGIQQVFVVVGYQATATSAAIGVHRFEGVEVRILKNPNWALGNGTSLAAAQESVYSDGCFVVVMSDHLFDPTTVADFIQNARGDPISRMLIDPAETPGIDSADATRVLLDDDRQVQRIGKRLSDFNATDCGLFVFTPVIFECLERSFGTGDHSMTGALCSLINGEGLLGVPLTRGFWQDVDTPADLRSARLKLARNLGGATDGLIARYLNRPISRLITLRLARFRWSTPNRVTWGAFLTALGASLLFVLGFPFWGGLAAQFASVLDGVDGELARLKFASSGLGKLLDSILDRYADGALLLAMGYLAYSGSPGPWPIVVTGLALLGAPMSMAFKDRHRISFNGRQSGPETDGWGRFLLASRDGRLFVVMLGGISGLVFESLVILAITPHLLLLLRLVRTAKTQAPGAAQHV